MERTDICATAAAILGEHAETVASLAIQLYKTAHEYALKRGVIIADTKFEFGVDEETNEVVLADEVLTPTHLASGLRIRTLSVGASPVSTSSSCVTG